MGQGDPRLWSARRACEAISAKEISAAEYVGELLDACEKAAGLNAFITLDHDHARAAAKRIDEGDVKGRLGGLPIAFKDAIGTADLPTTAGTKALAAYRPARDAEVVSRLANAGAFAFGKLNMHELSYGITSNNAAYGPVRNPYDRARIPGGSSGGAGAAVAAGLVPVALGTDTGGSVRVPAALCGVVGFRPSIGRYPQAGIVPVSETRDTAGPLCRSVDDVAMIDATIAGEDDSLASLSPSDLRIGIPRRHFLDNLDPGTRQVFEARLDDLRAAGWTFEIVDIQGIEPPTEACGFPIAVYETKGALLSYLEEHAPSGPSLAELVDQIESPDVKGILGGMLDPQFEDMAPAYRDAMENRRPTLQDNFARCFSDNRLDAIVFPTTVLPAAPIGDDETTLLNGEAVPTFPTFIHNTDLDSTAGIPGISIPAGLTPDGLPVGLELDGPFGSDRHLLAVAKAMEAALPAMPRPNGHNAGN